MDLENIITPVDADVFEKLLKESKYNKKKDEVPDSRIQNWI